jgi:hypothetical protein
MRVQSYFYCRITVLDIAGIARKIKSKKRRAGGGEKGFTEYDLVWRVQLLSVTSV